MNRLRARQAGLTYEVVVVAQSAAELPLPPGAQANFVLKRRHRLCVTEAEAVGPGGTVEWNTRCTQTATLFKHGDSWRPKEFGVKVQVLRDNPRLGQEQMQTVAKATLDLSQFCLPEPFGPKQLVIPLQPSGVLSVSISTHWLQNFNRDADTLTDLSYLSLPQSAMTSVVGAQQLAAEEQDLSGFDAAAAQESRGAIRAAWQQQQQQPAGGAGPSSAAAQHGQASALKKRLPAAAAMLRLPRRGASSGGIAADKEQQQQVVLGAPSFEFASAAGAPMHRSATVPCISLADGAAAAASSVGVAAGRRPAGASLLQIPDVLPAAGGGGGGMREAQTPTLFGQPQQTGGRQQQQQGVEAWSPVNLQEAVDIIYDSDEQPTPKPSVMGTMKRMFTGRACNQTPPLPGSTARQLHATFGTPHPTLPPCAPDPREVATIDREMSASWLRRRCKQLLAERDEARAEGYAEAALAVEQSLEIDKLSRTKDMLLARLQTTEEQLLACYRDEAQTDMIRALAETRVEAAQREFTIMELQGELRKKDAVVQKLQAQLTRAETKYRQSMHAMSPGKVTPPPASAWSTAGGADGDAQQEQHDAPCSSETGSAAAAVAAGGSPHALPSRLAEQQLQQHERAATAATAHV